LRATEIPGFKELSGPEKVLLVEEIWDTIVESETELSVPASHRKELDRRLSNHQSSPGRLLTLEELQQRVQARK
jgi:putative addiction module component (TIGR02574 family)